MDNRRFTFTAEIAGLAAFSVVLASDLRYQAKGNPRRWRAPPNLEGKCELKVRGNKRTRRRNAAKGRAKS